MRFVLISFFLAAGCGEKEDPVQPVELPICDATTEFCPLQHIFVRSCAISGGCHVPGGDGPMSLLPNDAYASLVNQPTTNLCAPGTLRVAPGDPDASCIMILLGDDTMPLEGPALSQAEKDMIRDWIAAGAPR
jgi:hypothetical protein